MLIDNYVFSHHARARTHTHTQIKEFWKKLAWPDLLGSNNFVLKVIDVSELEIVPLK